jgi:hypothetical protein
LDRVAHDRDDAVGRIRNLHELEMPLGELVVVVIAATVFDNQSVLLPEIVKDGAVGDLRRIPPPRNP